MYNNWLFEKLDSTKIYETYELSRVDENHLAKFIRSLCPVVKKCIDIYKGNDINYNNAEEYVSISVEIILKTIRGGKTFENPYHIYSFFKTTYINIIRQTFKNQEYAQDISESVMFETSCYSHKSVYDNLDYKDTISLLVKNFNNRVRFVGDERKICTHIFDCIMRKAPIDYQFLRVAYNLDPKKYEFHTRVIIKDLLYKLSDKPYLYNDI